MTAREKREHAEAFLVCERGVRAVNSAGRLTPEEPCELRTCFQRDVDRIIHSKAFRRLKHKTQVFLQPEGDHYRTRLTHTLEVARIARTIARGLELNEDLTEAIALGHDLGHTPFGHAGERALDQLLRDKGGFRHYEQSLRVVDLLEKDGRGLNLTMEVREGILRHTTDPLSATLEGQTVRLADRVAYINHDIDDALRAGIIREEDLPDDVHQLLGTTHSKRIDTLTKDIVSYNVEGNVISVSPRLRPAFDELHAFLYERVYRNPVAKGEESKVEGILFGIAEYYRKHPELLPPEYVRVAETEGLERAVCDFVSGMTDSYAVRKFSELFIPLAWSVQ